MTSGTDGKKGLFDRPGAMAALMRALDWSKTPVGPVEGWPQSLRATVRTLLTSRYPMILTWGPDFIQFYNDAYSELIGAKHPGALGTDIRVAMAEAWGTLGPLIEEVMRTGQANWIPALRLRLERAGYPEEAYFSVSHAPSEDEDGRIVGMLAVCSEVTAQILGERRMSLLRDLAAKAGEAREVATACAEIAATVEAHPLDVPFLLLYLRGAEDGLLHLCGAVGLAAEDASVPSEIRLEGGAPEPWGLLRALAGEDVVIEGVERLVSRPAGPWGEPVRVAFAQPIRAAGQDTPLGVLVAGTSPNRALDGEYRSFLQLLAGQLSVTLNNAVAYEAERRRADALAALDRAKTEFFSNVSHEFRTPLTLMLGPLETLLAGAAGLSPADRNLLETLQRNGLRLLKLVNALLDFSRIEAGRARARLEPTDLCRFTAEIAGSFRSAIESAGLRFTVDCPTLPRQVPVDRDMWEKIVLNLLSNALKFTLSGSIALDLRGRPEGVEMTVSDTGIGIDPSEQARVFERFHRVSTARGRTHEGTGIGLSLVRELARLHGGEVRVESAPGQGSRFTVALPWTPALPESAQSGAGGEEMAPTPVRAEAFAAEARRWSQDGTTGEEWSPPDGSPSGGRVLVVDDNADMRDYVARILAPLFAVETATDGAEALERIRRSPPDLVLSDVMMPRLDGFGLLAALRGSPATRGIPVVLLSARAGEEASVEGLEAGADDYLVKPFSSRELIARVRANLAMVRLRREAAAAHHDAERMRALGQITAGVAHDFNNLLMVLRGALHLMERRTSEPAMRTVLENANQAVDRGALMTRQLLSFSRRQRLEPQALDLNERLAELTEVLGRVFPEDIRIVFEPGPPGSVLAAPVLADRAELEAALLNVAVNARDAMPGGGTLRFETACAGPDGLPDALRAKEAGGTRRYGLIRIADSGAGMPEEVVQRAFEPFFTTKPAGKGTGLGLSQVYGFAVQSGGHATLSSCPGEGTVITLYLPVAE
ncbi:ATP-binding protein [Azospirillum sp. SYSU D00513]|uniref:ATP-binding protein n=1 Tax=Azospirillum sp. SYSU D00513 TaxID=2812561 RepID=UPI001A97116A|nr:ATP-binding protein [Azospirillum sp. SYSU D00513]